MSPPVNGSRLSSLKQTNLKARKPQAIDRPEVYPPVSPHLRGQQPDPLPYRILGAEPASSRRMGVPTRQRLEAFQPKANQPEG